MVVVDQVRAGDIEDGKSRVSSPTDVAQTSVRVLLHEITD
jgi:hypothetical protein